MIQDNTAKWRAKKLSSLNTSSGIPVGFEYISMNPNIPQGSLPMFGGIYDRKVYADLWAWIQQQAGYVISDSEWQALFNSNEGNVPFYSMGDGNTTFRVPSINCWVKGASGVEEVSSYLQAGLPTFPDMSHTHTRGTMNITGTAKMNTTSSDVSSASIGALDAVISQTNNKYAYSGGTYYGADVVLDASKGWTGETSEFTPSGINELYGKSDTVQPKSIVGMWLVKAYGTISNVGNVETANILQAVEDSRIALRVW